MSDKQQLETHGAGIEPSYEHAYTHRRVLRGRKKKRGAYERQLTFAGGERKKCENSAEALYFPIPGEERGKERRTMGEEGDGKGPRRGPSVRLPTGEEPSDVHPGVTGCACLLIRWLIDTVCLLFSCYS